MKRALVLLLLAACATQRPVPLLTPADEAVLADLERGEGLVAERPLAPATAYILATEYDRKGDVASVVRWLEHLDAVGWDLGVGPRSFSKSSGAAEFQRVAARLAVREKAVHRATEAFRFSKERNVRSEGVTYDPVGDRFYFSGGAGLLLRVDRSGNISELPVEPTGKKFGRLGMDVDAERHQLWAASAVFDPEAGDEKGKSAISVFDLRDGKLLRRVWRGSADQPTLLNDLTLLADGTAFVTDSTRNDVVRLRPGAEAFEVFASGFVGPNGIAASADGRTLYVADFRGITRFDLATGARELLETTSSVNGIDGLVEHHGSLIGIQNVLGRPRVIRVHLQDGNRVELLESKNPLLNVPTTGVVAGGAYYFMANLGPPAERIILRIPLD